MLPRSTCCPHAATLQCRRVPDGAPLDLNLVYREPLPFDGTPAAPDGASTPAAAAGKGQYLISKLILDLRLKVGRCEEVSLHSVQGTRGPLLCPLLSAASVVRVHFAIPASMALLVLQGMVHLGDHVVLLPCPGEHNVFLFNITPGTCYYCRQTLEGSEWGINDRDWGEEAEQ